MPLEVLLKTKLYCRGQILSAKLAAVDDLPDELILADTGIDNIQEARKLLSSFGCGPTSMCIVLLIKRSPNVPKEKSN